MFKSYYMMVSLLAIVFGISDTVFAADSEFVLDGNTSSSSFSVKKANKDTIARFSGDGNVGIGTTSPTLPLEIQGPGNAFQDLGMEFENTTSGQRFVIYNDGTNGSESFNIAQPTEAPSLTVRATGNPGNVGIGTASPSSQFHVAGRGGARNVFVSNTGSSVNNPAEIYFQRNFTGNRDDQTKSAAVGIDNTRDFFIWLNGSDRFNINSTGNVGIGTKSPTLPLEIQGPGNAFQDLGMEFDNTTSGQRFVIYNDGTGGSESFNIAQPTERPSLTIRATGNPGNVGIGTAAPTERLHVEGNIVASGTIGPVSSRVFKKDIAYVSTKEAIDTLKVLNPIKFKYKEDNSGEEHLGFIAEDVPELVSTQSRNHLSLMDFTAMLTKVVQEQQRILKEQQDTIEEMTSRVKILEFTINNSNNTL